MAYPIVLAHGVARFDVLWKNALKVDNSDNAFLDRLHYFKGIRTMLKARRFDVYHSDVSWSAGVDKRADDLKKNILTILDKTKTQKVNIIAHSMGGLDARHMMFNDRSDGKIHEKIASLVTIATPHNGSPFADHVLNNLPFSIPLAKKIGIDIEALKDLTTVQCKAYNNRKDVLEFEEEITMSHAVTFKTYTGKQDFRGTFFALKLSHAIIGKEEGENDGLVSVKSAKWKDAFFQEPVIDNTDHLNELGWYDEDQLLTGEGPDALLERIHKLYAKIASEMT